MRSQATIGLLTAATLTVGSFGVAHASPALGCGVDSPCVTGYQNGSTVVFEWDGYQEWDHYNVRWSRPGKDAPQVETAGGQHGRYSISNVRPATNYFINVQGCDRDLLGYSDCGPWSEGNGQSSVTTAGVDDCKPPYVWRLANPSDRVCVTAKRQQLTAEQNQLADERRSPDGGAYGPATCRQGFVWREAFQGDVVCVLPATREYARRDNAEGPKRKFYA